MLKKIKEVTQKLWEKPCVRGAIMGAAGMALMWMVLGCATFKTDTRQIMGNCDTKFYESTGTKVSIAREDLSLKAWYALIEIEAAINDGADPDSDQWSEITHVWFVDASPEYAFLAAFLGVYNHNHPNLQSEMCVPNSGFSVEVFQPDSDSKLRPGTEENMQVIKDNMEWWKIRQFYTPEMVETALIKLAEELKNGS
jgi:hypothetical protein